MLTTVQNTARATVEDTLRESFNFDMAQGYWLPVEPGNPLVRISVHDSGYMVERRRNTRSAWMPIVTAHLAEFDSTSFRRWRSSYPVVEPVA